MDGTVYIRPGLPAHQNATTAAATLQEWDTGGATVRLIFQNTHATEPIELFLTQAAKDKGAGFGLTVNARTGLDLAVEVRRFWTRTPINPATFESLAIRRG